MSQFATAAELRDFVEVTGTTGQKSNTNLDLILQSSSDWLERTTGRVITASASNTARTFSTNGAAHLVIPDLRTVTTVTLQDATLTADASYWLLASRQAPDIYTGIHVRPWGQGRYSYLSNPEWFDRNLDSPLARYYNTLPNDLVITGLWGWFAVPAQWKLATLVLGAYHYHHADALFAAARQTPEGNVLDLSRYPVEVQQLVTEWRLGEQLVMT